MYPINVFLISIFLVTACGGGGDKTTESRSIRVDKREAFQKALEGENVKSLTFILKEGIDMDEGQTLRSLEIACRKDSEELIDLLWAQSLDMKTQNDLFDISRRNESVNVLRYILENSNHITVQGEVIEDSTPKVKSVLKKHLFTEIAKDGKLDSDDEKIIEILSLHFGKIEDGKIIENLKLSPRDRSRLENILIEAEGGKYINSLLVREFDMEKIKRIKDAKDAIIKKMDEMAAENDVSKVAWTVGKILANKDHYTKEEIIDLIPVDLGENKNEKISKLANIALSIIPDGKALVSDYETQIRELDAIKNEVDIEKNGAFNKFIQNHILEYFETYELIEQGAAERDRTLLEDAIYTAIDIAAIFIPVTGNLTVNISTVFVDSMLDSKARNKAGQIKILHDGDRDMMEKLAKSVAFTLGKRYETNLPKLSFKGIEALAELNVCYMFGYFIEDHEKFEKNKASVDYSSNFLTQFIDREEGFMGDLKKIKFLLTEDGMDITFEDFLRGAFINPEDSKSTNIKKLAALGFVGGGLKKVAKVFS